MIAANHEIVLLFSLQRASPDMCNVASLPMTARHVCGILVYLSNAVYLPLLYHAACDADIGKFQPRFSSDKRYTSAVPCTPCVLETVAIFLPLWFTKYLQEPLPLSWGRPLPLAGM